MKTILITFLAFIIFSFSVPVKAQKTIIHEPSGVKIIFPVHERIFPSSWYSEKIDGKYKALQPDEYARMETLVLSCLDKYPALMLKNDLEIVYVVHSLEFYGTGFGGTNSCLAIAY